MLCVHTDVMLLFTNPKRKNKKGEGKKNKKLLTKVYLDIWSRWWRVKMELQKNKSTFNNLVKILLRKLVTGALPHLTDSSLSSVPHFLPPGLPWKPKWFFSSPQKRAIRLSPTHKLSYTNPSAETKGISLFTLQPLRSTIQMINNKKFFLLHFSDFLIYLSPHGPRDVALKHVLPILLWRCKNSLLKSRFIYPKVQPHVALKPSSFFF